jgi:hypothetical protein
VLGGNAAEIGCEQGVSSRAVHLLGDAHHREIDLVDRDPVSAEREARDLVELLSSLHRARQAYTGREGKRRARRIKYRLTAARNFPRTEVFSFQMRVKVAYLLAGVTVLLLAAAAIATAARKPTAPPKSIVLGKTANYPKPGCPAPASCEVVAKVTGIQMVADAVPHPFRAPKRGTIVAWWLRLPTLSDTQLRSFNSFFGGDPAARLAILRRGLKGRFRLVRQSETQSLKADLGKKTRVRYKLTQPLRVEEGDYVGLTAVTWVPAFAVNLDGTQNFWLASRARKNCDTPSSKDPKRFAAYYKRNQAHLQASTARPYECTYRTARLLYWARIVPDPESSTPPAGTSPTK